MSFTKSDMYRMFWKLGTDWWKQIYDGKYHSLGPDVFDRGLHKNRKNHACAEPGYYASVKKAAEFASMELGKPLTKEMYVQIHTLACEHFAHVDSKVINVEKDAINDFRATNCDCSFNLVKQAHHAESKDQAKIKKYSFTFLHNLLFTLFSDHAISAETGLKKDLERISPSIRDGVCKKLSENGFYASKKVDTNAIVHKGYAIYENAFHSMERVNVELVNLQKKLQLSKPFATLRLHASVDTPFIRVNYTMTNPVEIEETLDKIIAQYNTVIQSLPKDIHLRHATHNEQALRAIAELFQNLEWLHPFYDGQGRTDLVLLSKLLTENGFNPPILYQPYFSSFEPLDHWVSYLKKGMEAWKSEVIKVESLVAIDPLKTISML
ncbi:Fic family protein [Legionella worsleiensis]|uniref:Fic/DOC family protein n=1 Tax=Legionella worsleiensis TaxID=45076 RepID=A0A0W1A9N7_9GAMM|nr:Fic family protein [Legionella worsleiensis]KTD77988.1 Fic/DOC family protein [Legionella worsleiensis]STY31539.1 Protein involved in cell division [Legionella worsleiensis]